MNTFPIIIVNFLKLGIISVYFYLIQRYMDISKYKEWTLCQVKQGWKFFQRNEHKITNFEKKICPFVSKTFKILVFSWKNRTEKKHIFAQKKAQKSTFQIITGKKGHECEKKAHVLFKSTLYDPCELELAPSEPLVPPPPPSPPWQHLCWNVVSSTIDVFSGRRYRLVHQNSFQSNQITQPSRATNLPIKFRPICLGTQLQIKAILLRLKRANRNINLQLCTRFSQFNVDVYKLSFSSEQTFTLASFQDLDVSFYPCWL